MHELGDMRMTLTDEVHQKWEHFTGAFLYNFLIEIDDENLDSIVEQASHPDYPRYQAPLVTNPLFWLLGAASASEKTLRELLDDHDVTIQPRKTECPSQRQTVPPAFRAPKKP